MNRTPPQSPTSSPSKKELTDELRRSNRRILALTDQKSEWIAKEKEYKDRLRHLNDNYEDQAVRYIEKKRVIEKEKVEAVEKMKEEERKRISAEGGRQHAEMLKDAAEKRAFESEGRALQAEKKCAEVEKALDAEVEKARTSEKRARDMEVERDAALQEVKRLKLALQRPDVSEVKRVVRQLCLKQVAAGLDPPVSANTLKNWLSGAHDTAAETITAICDWFAKWKAGSVAATTTFTPQMQELVKEKKREMKRKNATMDATGYKALQREVNQGLAQPFDLAFVEHRFKTARI